MMKVFKGKVAVISGAASGIGRGLAERCAQEGMRVVLADVEEPALAQTAVEMKAAGAEVLPVVTDVSRAEDVQALAGRGGRIGVSVICPGWVRTNIMDSERNRPAELADASAETAMTPEVAAFVAAIRQECEAGMPPAELADYVFQAMRAGKFYILPDEQYLPLVQARAEALVQGQNPPPLV